MRPIAKPVYRPTADCIRRSFQNSGAKHLLVTGARGAGKTTLLSALCGEGRPGVTTFAQPGEAVYLRTLGETLQIGSYDATLPGNENKMRPRPAALLRAAALLERCADMPGEWFLLDEIGYLECTCPAYLEALERLMARKRVVAAVRKQPLPALQRLLARPDAFVADLDAPFGNTGCVVMASGMGTRFGSNKLLADFRGQPLLQWALAATEGIFAARVVVTRHREVEALCRSLGVACVLHNSPHRSDTVRLGLEAMPAVERCLFCPGDQPLLTRETVAALAISACNQPEAIWRTAFADSHGAPVLFPDWAFEALLALPEGAGGGYVVKKNPGRVRTLPVREEKELWDVDTPQALQRLLGE